MIKCELCSLFYCNMAEDGWKDFKDAYKKNLKQGILLFFLYGIIGVCVALLDYYVAVILMLASNGLIIIFPALVMLIASYLTEPALRRYMPKKEEDDGDWRYGFS